MEALRTQEQYILSSYKDYLQILEVFSKLKVAKLSKGSTDKDKSAVFYERLRAKSVACFGALLDRHPHFNFRLNILQLLAQKLSSQDVQIREVAGRTLSGLLRKDDNSLLEFKVDILKEISKVLKTKSHEYMDPHLLDCLVLHEIIVDEAKAKAVDESSKRS